MARDKKNFYQETAAQIRQKIKQFKKRPAYFVKFITSCGKLPASSTEIVV
jgi:ABC-type Fe3+-hydroxamate transport system substrate-binding protein